MRYMIKIDHVETFQQHKNNCLEKVGEFTYVIKPADLSYLWKRLIAKSSNIDK